MILKRLIISIMPLLLLLGCGKGNDASESPAIALDPPAGLRFHSATQNSLTFQWNSVSGAKSYQWLLTKDGESVKEGSATARNCTVDGLSKGTTYAFSVCAVGESSRSAYCEPVQGTTQGTAPSSGGTLVKVDEPLVLSLESVPVLGSEGLIRVFKKEGGEVDRINLADIAKVTVLESGVMVPSAQITNQTLYHTFMDAISGGSRYRAVHYTPLRIKGKSLEIKLHSGVLDFDTEYYLTMDAGVIQGHPGIAEGEWPFTTSGAPASNSSLKVAKDGSGDFCTIQGALSYASASGCEIAVSPGVYEELLYMRDKSSVTIKGESRSSVVIRYPNNESYANGTGGGVSTKPSVGNAVGTNGGRCLLLVENCQDFSLENLTLENSFYAADHKGQAECIYFNSGNNTHRMNIENCSLLSWQDTFLTKGRVYVGNSLIAGHVDYIWGYPSVCLFENCEIRSRAAGYIVQARCPSGSTGFVFLNCSLTAEDGVPSNSVYLARSGGNASDYDNVLYVNCSMGISVAAAGWYTSPAPNPKEPTVTSGWREYGSHTPSGAAVSGHNQYGRVLSDSEASAYLTKESIFSK